MELGGNTVETTTELLRGGERELDKLRLCHTRRPQRATLCFVRGGRGRQSVSFPPFCAHYPARPHLVARRQLRERDYEQRRQNTTLTARGKYEKNKWPKNMHQVTNVRLTF